MYSITPAGERRLLWLLALTQFTIIMDFMVMMPLGPQIMQAFQISPAAFATAVSAYSWCAGLSGLLGATYVDRFDRRKLLLVVYALFAVSNLICALAPNFHLLLIARAFAGITGGVLASVIMAIVGDVIPAQRRGAAMGTIMTAFSLAAIAGVPAGVLLGAHFGWATPFFMLTAMSALICFAASSIVPSLAAHLQQKQPALKEVLPNLGRLLTKPDHVKAFALTFTLMVSHMMVIPFISPVLVANYGVAPADLSWIYMAGGAAAFFSSRIIGRMADRYGKRDLFRVLVLLSMLPVLFMTHMPHLPFIVMLLFFPFFMVLVAGRMIPMQALLTTVPVNTQRGAFLSANSALQALGNGCGAWLAGLMLSTTATGQISGYSTVGLVAVALLLPVLWWVGKVKAADDQALPT
ncbi:MFS transporter [Stenotrophobium rhamnosiphilum]|uniref:MFS transporter n=1 Tax=Stenotrophobium rhamnosiphilum TaxID=2029166 RepID=A0A2T5MG33_9GAMM|nr:MFS transporter [Stenotrophobium rhamnosiphilum]PTU31520.1 MFS transporter [Stenotrophobium rhamnosiphilum]